jgi:hypothetical protein
MKVRCYDPYHKDYMRYGGRGIKVCAEWLHDFQAFYSHVGPRPSSLHSIDRINSDGDYEPGNVKWSTTKQQNRNTSFNRLHTIAGITMCTVEWAEALEVDVKAVYSRMRRGWSIEDALHTPIKPRRKK